MRFLRFNLIMNVESLKMFCDLVETKSFTQAGRINEVTQSAISQQVSAMERLFKAVLIQRGKGEFKLTPVGELVYQHSKEIAGIAGGIATKLDETRKVASGIIRLATIFSIGLYDLPSCIKKFLKHSPNASVHVAYRNPQQIYEEVVSNEVDLGLVDYPVRIPGVEIIPLRQDPLVLICHPQDPLAKRKAVRFKSLQGQKFIGFDRKMPLRNGVDRIFRQHHMAVKYAMEFDSIETVKRAVEIYSSLAIVPEATIRQDIANHTLAVVRLDDGLLSRPLAAIHKHVKVLSPAMKELIALLKEPV